MKVLDKFEEVKPIFIKYWTHIVILILAFLLFRNCESGKELALSNRLALQNIKTSELKQQNYVKHINLLKSEITLLESKKQTEKTKVVTIIKEVEKKINIVNTMTTKEIAIFYQSRYKTPIVITQYGVAFKDTIAKKNIVELAQKDGLEKELFHTKKILSFSESQNLIKDTLIVYKDSILSEKDIVINNHKEVESNLNRAVKSEKSKKTFWQITSGAVLVGMSYLLITSQ